jgi:hypothetical protein
MMGLALLAFLVLLLVALVECLVVRLAGRWP